MAAQPVGVAVVGAGVISQQYLTNLITFPDIAVLGIADIDQARAASVAAEYGVAASGDLAGILAIPEVEIVLNLTIPAAHAEVDLAALRAGKHVFSEKPLTLDPVAGAELLAEADARGLRIGCAPDTFLGAGLQSAERALQSGLIGTPFAAVAAMELPGPERWHPNPEFLYQPGAGPLFDMGPYYLTALTMLLGSITRVAATARTGRPTRTFGAGPRIGETFAAATPTHVAALLDFAGGETATASFSFDASVPRTSIDIIGTEGTLSVPDPNKFAGELRVRRAGDEDWTDVPVEGPATGRGMGLLDMARAIRSGADHRASGRLAQHVLEVMAATLDSGAAGEFRQISSSAPKVAALPSEWDPTADTLS